MSKSPLPLCSLAPPDDASSHCADIAYGQGLPPHEAAPLRSIGRPDALTSQHVEVGIVLNAMLGFSAANDYLVRHEIDSAVITRVLSTGGQRRGEHDANGIRVAGDGC